jgi:hypothetical protein
MYLSHLYMVDGLCENLESDRGSLPEFCLGLQTMW